MFSAVFAGALIVGASLLLGVAIMAIAGLPRHSASVPATGISALLVICGVAVKLPGYEVTAAIAVGLALVACFFVFGRSTQPAGGFRVGAVVVVIGAVLVAAIPFATSGRVGILGQGLVNDDMASHLLFTEWISSHAGPTPDLIKDGYPLGPHAIVAAAAKVSGASLIEGFAGLTGAIAVLLGLTAYGALRGVRGCLRVPAAVLAASTYLSAAYLAQGAFKEPLLALALLGFALALPPLLPEWSRDPRRTSVATAESPDFATFGGAAGGRAAIPLGVIAAGTIYNYSFPGLAWLLGAAVIWMLAIAIRERDGVAPFIAGLRVRERLSGAKAAIWLAIGIPVVCALPELFRLASFSSFEAFNPSGTGPTVGFGNLRQPLNPLEAFGIWPSGEFRITPANSTTPEIAFYLGGLLALTAFAWSLGRALSRRESALPSALLAATLVYLGALALGTPYTQGKCLAIAAPLIMLISLRGLLAADAIDGEQVAVPEGGASWWPPGWLRPLVPIGVPLLTLAFAAAAAFSTLLPLRQAAVGPDYHLQEMLRMRPIVDGQNVLFLGRDNFVSWELIGSEVYAPITNHYDVEEVPALYRATDLNAKFDWDNVPPHGTDPNKPDGMGDFEWVITTSAAMQSEAPPGFTPRLRTQDFILWHRDGAIGQRRTLLEPINPGAPLDCTEPGESQLRTVGGTATAFTVQPVVGRVWRPSPELTQSKPTTQSIYLTPGRWDISIQYASTQPLQVAGTGPGLAAPFRAELRTNLLFRGPSPFYPVGSLVVEQPGEVAFDIQVKDPPAIGRLLGTESKAYLTGIAATRSDPARQAIPLRRSCGRYVDWYEVTPGTPASALEGVPAPQVQPVSED